MLEKALMGVYINKTFFTEMILFIADTIARISKKHFLNVMRSFIGFKVHYKYFFANHAFTKYASLHCDPQINIRVHKA